MGFTGKPGCFDSCFLLYLSFQGFGILFPFSKGRGCRIFCVLCVARDCSCWGHWAVRSARFNIVLSVLRDSCSSAASAKCISASECSCLRREHCVCASASSAFSLYLCRRFGCKNSFFSSSVGAERGCPSVGIAREASSSKRRSGWLRQTNLTVSGGGAARAAVVDVVPDIEGEELYDST